MGSELKVLLVSEGSGGHLIPALEVASLLARTGAHIKVWYVERPQTARFVQALTRHAEEPSVDVDPIPLRSSANPLERLWQCGQLWHRAERCFETFSPDVVVGFGGWVSAPVVLAARRRRIGCLLHEQNVLLGRANRLLARWVDGVAVSFRETQVRYHRVASVMTGMPVRGGIGHSSRVQGAQRFDLNPNQPTLLIVGGSQGARPINHLMTRVATRLSPHERQTWQVIRLVGAIDETPIKKAYAACGLTAWVAPFLLEMETAYAQADLVIARAGASTIAELARCGKPAILIPYPYAGAHQRANAQLVEAMGGGLMIEESQASPERILSIIRRIVADQRLRVMMGQQMHALHRSDAAQRLTQAIVELAHAGR